LEILDCSDSDAKMLVIDFSIDSSKKIQKLSILTLMEETDSPVPEKNEFEKQEKEKEALYGCFDLSAFGCEDQYPWGLK